MKKGQKPPRSQTATLMALNMIGKRMQTLVVRGNARKLHEEELTELMTLRWVVKILRWRDEEKPPEKPEGFR